MMIKKFNDNHAQSQQRLALSAKAAQIQIAAKPNKNVTDNIILFIKDVRKNLNNFEIEWKNGSSLKLYFNGRYEKYNCVGKLSSTGGVGTSRGFMDDGHIVLFINGKRFRQSLQKITTIIPLQWSSFLRSIRKPSKLRTTASRQLTSR